MPAVGLNGLEKEWMTSGFQQGASATFSPITYTLSLSLVANSGDKVTSSPSGIDCGSSCSHNFNSGTQVTLTAIPDGAWGLAGWGGGCSGIGSCTLTINGNTSVSASFMTLFGGPQAPVVTSPNDVPLLPPPVLSPYPQ